jgi:PAS domain S-box-containing protein
VQEATRILILEDVLADVARINDELRGAGLKFRCKRVETREDFVRELQQHAPDIILSDYRLPALDGFTALALASDQCPDTPFIFVTAAAGELMAIEMFKSGAADYVLKERLGDLGPAVRRALRQAKDRAKRRAAETEQRESAECFRRVLESLEDFAIFMLDRNGRVTFWNAGAEHLYGWRAEETKGRHISMLYADEEVAQGKPQQDLTATARGGRLEGEGQRLAKGGKRLLAHVLITALCDPKGVLRGFLHVTRSAARDLQGKEALRDGETTALIREELERRVARRTAELEMANTELEAFSFSISHELRAPLRRMSGFADLLRTEAAPKLNETSKKRLQTIIDGAQQMSCLIDALLQFSRMGRSEMRNEMVDLAQLVAEARGALNRDIEGRDIQWTIGDLPPTHGDPLMLQQVVINLLSNALKYTRPRNPARIEIGAKSEGGETIYFVGDNGVGFDMNYAAKLFGVFQRLHSPREFEGTGIGLATVRRILRRHGGRVWAESGVDQGATFYFSIPMSAGKVTK